MSAFVSVRVSQQVCIFSVRVSQLGKHSQLTRKALAEQECWPEASKTASIYKKFNGVVGKSPITFLKKLKEIYFLAEKSDSKKSIYHIYDLKFFSPEFKILNNEQGIQSRF